MAKTIFNMADGILTPCNVAWSWHWFRQVTAPCNVAYGLGIVTLNSPSGSTRVIRGSWTTCHWFRQVTAPCNVAYGLGIVTLNSPSGSTRVIRGSWTTCQFAQWQHPAMWHIALESRHWICQVSAPCSVAGGSGMTCHWICPNVRHIGILHLVLISTISQHVILHQFPKFYPNRTTLGRKKWHNVYFQDSDLSHLGL